MDQAPVLHFADFLGPAVAALLFVAIVSQLSEPARRHVNVVLLAGAAGVYMSGGLGPWELPFSAAILVVSLLGFRSYRFIGLGWLMHALGRGPPPHRPPHLALHGHLVVRLSDLRFADCGLVPGRRPGAVPGEDPRLAELADVAGRGSGVEDYGRGAGFARCAGPRGGGREWGTRSGAASRLHVGRRRPTPTCAPTAARRRAARLLERRPIAHPTLAPLPDPAPLAAPALRRLVSLMSRPTMVAAESGRDPAGTGVDSPPTAGGGRGDESACRAPRCRQRGRRGPSARPIRARRPA